MSKVVINNDGDNNEIVVIDTLEKLETAIWNSFSELEKEGLKICHEAQLRAKRVCRGVVSGNNPSDCLKKGLLDHKYFIQLMHIHKSNRKKRMQKLINRMDKECFYTYDIEAGTCIFTYEGFIDAVYEYSNSNNKAEVKKIIKAIRRYNTISGKLITQMVEFIQQRNQQLQNANSSLTFNNNILICKNNDLKIEVNNCKNMTIKKVLHRNGIDVSDNNFRGGKWAFCKLLDAIRRECPGAILSEKDNRAKNNKKKYADCYVLDEDKFMRYIAHYRTRFFYD